jgi:photosystem II stability/assembly factor-like uncharacterized protein
MRLRLRFVLGLWLAGSCCALAAGQSWERLGPEGGLVVSLGTSANDGIYLGTADGHVFFSGDGAQTWELRGRVGTRMDAVVTRLVADPRENNRVYASVWYQAAGTGGGVFRSDDRGHTWTLLGLPNEAVRALEIADTNPDVLIAGTRTGVFRSRDEGKDWERISREGDAELRNVDSLAIDPGNADLVYAGTYHLPWKTQDGGKTWTAVAAGMIDDSDVMSLRIDASNPARVFLSACSGIYRSENQGEQWIKLQGIPYSARRTQAIVQDPSDPKVLFAGTTEGLWVTRDGGESWTRTTSKEWVVNSVVVLSGKSGKPGRVVLGIDGQGVQVSDDAGVHFTEANRGFTHMIVKEIVSNPSVPGHLLLVVQRGAEEILESRDAGKSWTPVSNPADAQKNIGKLPPRLEQIYASPWGWLARMSDGELLLRNSSNGAWKEWKLRLPATTAGTSKSTRNNGTRQQVRLQLGETPIAFAADAAFISSTVGLLRCNASGVCGAAKEFGRGGSVRALWVSPDGAAIAVVRDGKLALLSKENESTPSWRDLPVVEGQVLWVDVLEASPEWTIVLGTAAGLYVDSGENAPWKPVQGGLPRAPVARWLRGDGFWVAVEQGAGTYISRDSGASWTRVEGDLEHGQFTGLVRSGPGKVLASSQSEGVLELTLTQ